MLREIDELTRELKRPVESTRGTIHIERKSQIEKAFQALRIDVFAFGVLREKQTQREGVSHLSVVHFHVWSKLTGRRFWIISSETVDHVVCFRSVWHDAVAIEKIAPFYDHLRDATVVRKRQEENR